ncbi:cohesin domain-containing protein [Microbacterium sp. P07]|uniref:cohesin domain-containing protein n=1 Tax=Microbacterium sp. P07 TaxID=3366952 RepID=UPI003745F3E6
MSDTTGRRRMLRARAIALVVTTLTLAGGSALAAPAASAVAVPDTAITLEVAPDEVTEGETLEVTATATDAADLYAYDLTFSYDPALLEFDAESVVGPEGGFTATSVGDGLVAVTHTRLGTSPGLDGTVELGSFSFLALGGGDTVIELVSAELVDSNDDTVTLTDVDEVPVTLIALPDPTQSPSPTPSDSVTPTPSSTPTVAGTDPTTPDQPLAATGGDATPWLIAGAAGIVLIAGGALLAIRRRQAVSE